MKGRKWLGATILLSLFIVSAINVHAEDKLEKISEDIEELSIIKNEYYTSLSKIIVDKVSDDASYKSIQKAIDDALDGSTIFVKEGTYNEIVFIYKKINLIGENKEKTFICPESKKNGYAIAITAADVKISGFSVSNNGSGLYTTGIKIVVPNTTIEDCIVFDTPVGIAVWSSKNIISNCTFYDCNDEGIAFLGSSTSDCNNNMVTNCEFYDNCDGIELQYSSNNIISYCKFYDNIHAGIDAIGSSNNNVISNCNLYDNDAFGIYLSRSSENQITQCMISNSQIMMSSSIDNTIDDCDLKSIYLRDATLKIENCENFEESKIKTVNSVYEIYNEENEENKPVSYKKENGFSLSTILDQIRFRLITIKDWIANKR
jgi:parallel beta-helix repeat protein